MTQREASAPTTAGRQPKAGSPQTPGDHKPAAEQRNGVIVELKGQVLGPDGQAVAGANVCLATSSLKKKGDLKPRATTDADGRFRFTATRAELEPYTKIVANAKGYALDSIVSPKEGDYTLCLAADYVPITGRILDLHSQHSSRSWLRRPSLALGLHRQPAFTRGPAGQSGFKWHLERDRV